MSHTGQRDSAGGVTDYGAITMILIKVILQHCKHSDSHALSRFYTITNTIGTLWFSLSHDSPPPHTVKVNVLHSTYNVIKTEREQRERVCGCVCAFMNDYGSSCYMWLHLNRKREFKSLFSDWLKNKQNKSPLSKYCTEESQTTKTLQTQAAWGSHCSIINQLKTEWIPWWVNFTESSVLWPSLSEGLIIQLFLLTVQST